MTEERNRIPVDVVIKSEQYETNEHGTTEENDPITDIQNVDGELFFKGEQVYLRYEETGSKTTTLVKWEKDKEDLWVIRTGELNVRQHFSHGKETYANYTTPYGVLPLFTYTKSLINQLDKSMHAKRKDNDGHDGVHGSIVLNFSVRMDEDNEDNVMDHELEIRVKERFLH